MNADPLSTLNYLANILGPFFIIAPMIRNGPRYRPLLVAIFFLYFALHYAVVIGSKPPDIALPLSIATAGGVMFFGWVMSVVFRKREEAMRRDAAEDVQTSKSR